MKNQVSDGQVVSVVASGLTHPSHSDNLPHSGDPVVAGILVGVAGESAATSTSLIDVETAGVFKLSVTATDSGGNSAVVLGDQLYIDGSSAVITKDSSKTAYGIALGAVSSGATASIPVKLGAGPAGAAGGGSGLLQSATVTLTAAEMLALSTSPVEILAAPGANKFLLLV